MQRFTVIDQNGVINYRGSMTLDNQAWIEIFMCYSTKWTDTGILIDKDWQSIFYWRDGRVNVLNTRTNTINDYVVYWEGENGVYRNACSPSKMVN